MKFGQNLEHPGVIHSVGRALENKSECGKRNGKGNGADTGVSRPNGSSDGDGFAVYGVCLGMAVALPIDAHSCREPNLI